MLLSHPLPVVRLIPCCSTAGGANLSYPTRSRSPALRIPRSLAHRPPDHPPLHPVCDSPGQENVREEDLLLLPTSAAAIASAITRAARSPAEFVRRQTDPIGAAISAGVGSSPSPDFRRLCAEQLDLFRAAVHPEAVLSVYVRPAGSYIMDQLELNKVAFSHPVDSPDGEGVVSLVGNFFVPAGLRSAETALVKQEVEVVPEHNAVVLPMIKYPFVVGFLVVELPQAEISAIANLHNIDQDTLNEIAQTGSGSVALPLTSKGNFWETQGFKRDSLLSHDKLSTEWISKAAMISRSLAAAYIMDQKAILLQQTSWQNSIRMSRLVEQIRGPLSSVRALAKMLSLHVKQNEIPYDIAKDILTQGDHMNDVLQEVQDAVYLTKANIVRYNNDLNSSQGPVYGQPGISISGYVKEAIIDDNVDSVKPLVLNSHDIKDLEMPMPPLWLAPLQKQDTRPCNISDVLNDLVEAAAPLASKQRRVVEVNGLSHFLQVAIEESALRQALGNLIEGALLRSQIGGRVQIYAGGAPAGGVLLVIDDDGPDMQYMTQIHTLAPFGAELLGDGMLEDNLTWNFIAGLTVAREILEGYGCVLRFISPLKPDAATGEGGNRIEVWFPALQTGSVPHDSSREA